MTNAQAWDYAVGMIRVDGLEPTPDFKEYIEKEKRGEVDMADVERFLDKKYKVKDLTPVDENKPCSLDGKTFTGKILMEEGLAMKTLLKSEYSSVALQLVEVK